MPHAWLGRLTASAVRSTRPRVDGKPSVSTAGAGARSRWRRITLTAVALVAVSVTLAACGSSPSAAPPTTSVPSASTSTPTTNAATTTSQPSAEETAVLTAYRAGWAAYEHAVATANPADPALQATMVNPVLHQVIGNLVTYNMEGIVGKGSIALDPHVVSIDGTSATVVDCAYSSSFLVYKKTGKQVPPVTKPEHDADKATLVLVGSTWKTKSRQITEGSCPAGY